MIQTKTKSNIYLKNKDLYEEIIKSKDNGALTVKAQTMLILLTAKFITSTQPLLSITEII